jgi:hypothetical protein
MTEIDAQQRDEVAKFFRIRKDWSGAKLSWPKSATLVAGQLASHNAAMECYRRRDRCKRLAHVKAG